MQDISRFLCTFANASLIPLAGNVLTMELLQGRGKDAASAWQQC
ncbi:hypothetical protein HMPREF3034_00085 [Prevotella sp. DNF00663]|nr:hypothetical protein HMPREF3034_00085 [Prevotella sp. DNF00663]